MTALKNETLEAATPSESANTSPCKELEAVYQAGTTSPSHEQEAKKTQANLYRVPSANGKHTLEAFTAREGDGGDYQLVSNTLRRRLSEHTRANPKRSGEALSALALWHYLHEKAGRSGTTYELSYADVCFDLGLVTEGGAAKAKRLKELVSVLVEIGALYVERATYRTLSGSTHEGGYYYTPSLTVKTKAEAVEAGLPEPISEPSSSKKRVRVSSRSSIVDTVSTAEGSSPQATSPTPTKTPTPPSGEEEVTLSGGSPFTRSIRYKKDSSLDSQSVKKERLISEGQTGALEAIWLRLKIPLAKATTELLAQEGIEHLQDLSRNRADEIIRELNSTNPKLSVYEQYLAEHPEEEIPSVDEVMTAKGIEPMDYEQAYRPQEVLHRRERSRSDNDFTARLPRSTEIDEAEKQQRRDKAEAFRLMAANAMAVQQ